MKELTPQNTASPKLETAEFVLETVVYTPYQKVASHSHESAFFCMALQGVCTENYRNSVRAYEPFTMSFLPADVKHSLEFYKPGMRSLGIEIKPLLMKKIHECSLNIDRSVHSRGGSLNLLFKKAYSEFFLMDSVSHLAIEGLILEMLTAVSRKQIKATGSSRRLKRAVEIIHDRFAENLTLREISQEIGLHPVYLSRLFHRHYRCTISEYIRRLRVEYASRQIILTNCSLLDISSNAGFSDQSHFSRVFKLHMGVTPTEYRTISSKS